MTLVMLFVNVCIITFTNWFNVLLIGVCFHGICTDDSDYLTILVIIQDRGENQRIPRCASANTFIQSIKQKEISQLSCQQLLHYFQCDYHSKSCYFTINFKISDDFRCLPLSFSLTWTNSRFLKTRSTHNRNGICKIWRLSATDKNQCDLIITYLYCCVKLVHIYCCGLIFRIYLYLRFVLR